MNGVNKKQLLTATLLVLMAAVPATIFLSQQNQEARSRATASTTLSYLPESTNVVPLQKNIGDATPVDVMINPGSNLVSLVTLELQYDSTKFSLDSTPFTVNTTAFPKIVEGPVLADGKVLISVSIGSDSTRAIHTFTKVGTLHLVAKADTATAPTLVAFGNRSQVLSIATNDQATENVLSTTSPAYIAIARGAITPQPTQITALSPTAPVSPTTTTSTAPSLSPEPSVSPQAAATTLSFTAFLHGIGSSGDNANPTGSDLSNKSPLHKTRDVTIYVYDTMNQLKATSAGTITYASASGNFTGTVDLGNAIATTTGVYTVLSKENTHLRKLVAGIQQLRPSQNNVMSPIALVAGDINNDNSLNILDYNLLIGCYSDLLPAVSCTDSTKILTDSNDDGAVNQFDYNLFLREITVQNGN